VGTEIAATVAAIASRQHGVVSTQQLRGAGLSKRAIDARVEQGHLHRIHRRVYAVGHPGLSREGRWMAAVLACCGHGDVEAGGSFLSHRSGAALWGLLPGNRGPVHVAIIGENGRARHRGVRVHRPRTLEERMTSRRWGIPVTGPARTISDLRLAKPTRGGATPAELRRAIREASVLGISLGRPLPPDRTRSELEHLFLDLRATHGLTAPKVNSKIAGIEVDFVWPDRRLVVETDGYRFHRGRPAFDEDRRRGLLLRSAGYEVIRLSHEQVTIEPESVAAALRERLAAI
jgi:very-short-patch-repair endonuclease